MKVTVTAAELRNLIKESGLTPVGFVPTMGALHEGHLSLVRNATGKCPIVVVSIFVNPTQFNDRNDLRNYPRTLEADLSLLKRVLRQNDLIFSPSDKEIYPEPDTRLFHFGNLNNVMEALHRPGHFNGVAQVVSRLFDIVRPDIVFFGLKDLQQVAVIRELVRQLGYNIKIIGNPIIREPDGLAMSSRNKLLEPEIRKKASVIFKTISAAAAMIKDREISQIKKYVTDSIEKTKDFRIEYFEIADDVNLIPVRFRKEMKKESRYRGCIAVNAGGIRLIDNIEFPLP